MAQGSTGSKFRVLSIIHHVGEDRVEKKNPMTPKKSSSPLPQCTAVWAYTPPEVYAFLVRQVLRL